MCGEKTKKDFRPIKMEGSPPRVRGKAAYEKVEKMIKGITPACAGKRRLLCVEDLGNKDHPRVCGEKRTAWHYIGV